MPRFSPDGITGEPAQSEDLRQRLNQVYERALVRYPPRLEPRAIAAVEMPLGGDGRYHITVANMAGPEDSNA